MTTPPRRVRKKLPPNNATRFWGAVMTEDGPKAEVRDVEYTFLGTVQRSEGLLTYHVFADSPKAATRGIPVPQLAWPIAGR